MRLKKKNNMCDGKRYVSVSIKADVYDLLCHLSSEVVPGTRLSIAKVIEVLTKQKNNQPERIAINKNDEK